MLHLCFCEQYPDLKKYRGCTLPLEFVPKGEPLSLFFQTVQCVCFVSVRMYKGDLWCQIARFEASFFPVMYFDLPHHPCVCLIQCI